DAHYRARLGEVRANAWLLRPALDFVNVILIVALVAAIGTQSLQGVEVGLLYAFIAYVARVVDPLIQITMQFSVLQQSVIAAARADEFIARLPQGYDTELGEGGARLSSGQKQLVAIARALAGSPRVLLLDEATSRIDSETERAVRAALADVARRSTVIAIAHR